MKCEDCIDLLAAYLDGEVTQKEKMQIESHLAICSACAKEAEEIRAIMDELACLPMLDLPDGYHEELMGKLEQEAKVVPLTKKKQKKFAWKQFSVVAAAALLVVATGGIDNILQMRQQAPEIPEVMEDGEEGIEEIEEIQAMVGAEVARIDLPESSEENADVVLAVEEPQAVVVAENNVPVKRFEADTPAVAQDTWSEPLDIQFDDVSVANDLRMNEFDHAQIKKVTTTTVVDDKDMEISVTQIVDRAERSILARSIVDAESAEIAVDQIRFISSDRQVGKQFVQQALDMAKGKITDDSSEGMMVVSVQAKYLQTFYDVLGEFGGIEKITSTFGGQDEGNVIIEIVME